MALPDWATSLGKMCLGGSCTQEVITAHEKQNATTGF